MTRRRRKALLGLFLVFAIIIVIMATLYFIVLPLYAAAQIRAMLNDAGVKDATFSLKRVSLAQLEIANLDIGQPQWLGVESITVRYSISSLWNNRLKSIDLSRARWTVKGGDHGIDWGYHLPPRSTTRPAGAAALHDLPVGLLRISDSTVALDWKGRSHEIAVAASMTRSAPGKFILNLQAATASADGRFDLTGDSAQGVLVANLPATHIADLDVLRDLIPQLHGAELGGTCTADATLHLAKGRFDPVVAINADHVKASHPDWSGSIEEASGTVVINNLAALSTPPHQQITIAKATLGPTHISDAQITFAVQRPDSIDIERASWSMGELGHFDASPFAFNPSDPQLSTELQCRNVGLGSWLDLLTNGRAAAQGTLEGRVQLSYQPRNRIAVKIATGGLHSVSAGGWIRTGEADTLEKMLAQSVAEGSVSGRWNEIKDRVVRALQDFQYSMFNVELEPEGDDTVCRLTTAGKGRQGPEAQEIGSLTVNIHQFGYVLDNVLRGKSAFGSRE